MHHHRHRTPSLLLASMLACGATAPLFAQASDAPAPAPAPASAPAVDLPAPEALLARHVAAIGGEEALAALKQVTSKGTFEMPAAGVKGPMTSYAEDPTRFAMIVDLPGIGAIRTGYDGRVAWSLDPMQGPRLLEGGELRQLKRDADFRRDLNLFSGFEKVEVKGATEFAGAPTYEVLCSGGAEGANDMTMFFAREEGLLRGLRLIVDSPLGRLPVETVFLEYRSFDGPGGALRLPARSEIRMLNQAQVLTIESVDFGPIDASVFELPREIVALAEGSKANQPKPAEPANPPSESKSESESD